MPNKTMMLTFFFALILQYNNRRKHHIIYFFLKKATSVGTCQLHNHFVDLENYSKFISKEKKQLLEK